jgi:hypothetical protein
MARVIVEHFSTLGRYGQRILHEALEVVDSTADRGLRCWAYIKAIEALIDQAQYAQAKVTLEALRTDDVELDANTQIELALSSAAIERWTGHAERAKEFVDRAEVHAKLLPDIHALHGKVQLWHGLIHKDIGNWSEALNALTSVADAETMPLPFRARAQYQIGDALMRLGQLPLAQQVNLEPIAQSLEKFSVPIDVIEVCKECTALHQIFAVNSPTVFLVRPDGHVSFRGAADDLSTSRRTLMARTRKWRTAQAQTSLPQHFDDLANHLELYAYRLLTAVA